MIIAGIIFVGALCVAIIWSSMIVAKRADERMEEEREDENKRSL